MNFPSKNHPNSVFVQGMDKLFKQTSFPITKDKHIVNVSPPKGDVTSEINEILSKNNNILPPPKK